MDRGRGEDQLGTIRRRMMRSKETAVYLDISYWKLLEERKAGRIPHVKVGSCILFCRETLDNWLKEQETASIAKPEPVHGKIRRLR